MNRLEAESTLRRLREYRSRIVNDIVTRIDKELADGPPRNAKRAGALARLTVNGYARVRQYNERIDAIESYFPRTA